jgi:hypothetical protein
MNAVATDKQATQPTPVWTASRIFRATLAVVFGLLTALVATFTIFFLMFGPSGEVVGELVEVIDHETPLGNGAE